MNICNECGAECTGENEVTKFPENVIEYKCDYCYQDMLEINDNELEQALEE